jgi:hypothetical protein
MNKSVIGLTGSATLATIGILLRLKSYAIAWSGWSGSYSGPTSETSWGRLEIAVGQIGMALLAVGILMFVVTYVPWLFLPKSDK